MGGERLTSSDKRALLLWVVAGVVGALLAYKFYFRAFPEAAVNFQVSREEAEKRGQAFVSGIGESVSGYQSAIVFDVNSNAETYLERELGLQRANQVMSSQLHLWYWDVRFFRPQQEEEFHVRVSPAGQIVGYEHHVAENRAGASLDRAAAQLEAQNFVAQSMAVNLAEWDLLAEEVNSKQRPNRLDWSFTWEKRGLRAKDAPYRITATVDGDRIGSSEEFLKVPEAWERDFAQLRSRNDFIASVAILPYILILGCAVWLSIALTRRGEARWSGAVKIGLLVAALLFCMQLNELPIARSTYNTNTSYNAFLFKQLAIAVLFGLGSALTITIVLPAGDALYRLTQPGRLQLRKAFSWRGLRSKEFFSSSVVGLSLTAATLGFVVVFYMVGRKFGVWAPQDLGYENTVSTTFPWISGAAIGLLAATNEEFTFRLFAIPFIERLTGSRWMAVIVPAFCWSFLHANYPQEPPYIRGLEVGIMGVATGLVMLRWGILATLIWHYTFDASQVGLLLIRSNSWYFRISGIAVGLAALAPLLFAAFSYVQRGSFEADEDLLNSADAAPDVSLKNAPVEDVAAESGARRYRALTAPVLGFLALCLVACVALVMRGKPAAIGDYLQVSANLGNVKSRADEILRQHGENPTSFMRAVVFVDNTDAITNEYLRERVGVAGVNEIYAGQVPGALWRVRYFRDSQPEEFAVILRPDGTLHSVWHTLAEGAPGAQLSKEEAITRGENFLREEKHLDLAKWSLVDSESDKLPHRTDHQLTWEQKTPLETKEGTAGEAHARVELTVRGEEVTRYRTFVKIPDEWRREHETLTLPRILLGYALPVVYFVALGIVMLVMFLTNLRSEAARNVPWRRISGWAVWGLVGFVAVFAFGDKIAGFLNDYKTTIPFSFEIGSMAIGVLLGGPFYFAGIAMLFGVAWYFARRAFAEEEIPSWLGMPAEYYRDALGIGIGGTAALLGLKRLLQMASLHWPTIHRAIGASFGQDFAAPVPAAAMVGSALILGMFVTGLVAATAAFIAACVPQAWLRAVLLVGGALALVGGSWGSSSDFARQFALELLLLGAIVWGVRYIVRFNLLGCFLVVASTALVSAAAELLGQQDQFYRRNGFAVAAVLMLLLAWPLLAWVFPKASRGETAS